MIKLLKNMKIPLRGNNSYSVIYNEEFVIGIAHIEPGFVWISSPFISCSVEFKNKADLINEVSYFLNITLLNQYINNERTSQP